MGNLDIDVSESLNDSEDWYVVSGKSVNHGRWLIFFGSNYYPGGGVNDLRASFCRKGLVNDWLQDKKEYLAEMDWCHIYDTENQMHYTIPEFHEEFGDY